MWVSSPQSHSSWSSFQDNFCKLFVNHYCVLGIGYKTPNSHRLTNPTYRSMGDAISMSKNPIPKKRKLYFCCDYCYNVNFHRSVLVENLNSEISLALADHFRRPQKFSCRFENNYLPLRTPAHSFSFHNERTDRGMTKNHSWVIPHETGQGWRG